MAHAMPNKAQVIEKCGPYGSQEKLTFSFLLDKGDVITRVQIESGDVADALAFEILDTSGNYTTFRSDGTVTAGKLDSVKGRPTAHESKILTLNGERITRISGFELYAHESKILTLNGERITRISGFEGDYQGCRHIVQLYIHTDTLPGGYGPYGHKQNCSNIKAFSSPDPSTGPIVGFFGAQGTYLHSLGVYISKEENNIKQYGPYGRQVPLTFNFVLDKTERIKTVTLATGSIVDGIGFEIVDQSGTSKSLWYGGPGHETATINLRDTEQITQISGSYGDFAGNGYLTDVAQIYIHTNLAPKGYGPYGGMKDCKNIKSFIAPVDSTSAGPIVGFFGASARFLQSIGVSVRMPSDS